LGEVRSPAAMDVGIQDALGDEVLQLLLPNLSITVTIVNLSFAHEVGFPRSEGEKTKQ
jgi:hypothetical protein